MIARHKCCKSNKNGFKILISLLLGIYTVSFMPADDSASAKKNSIEKTESTFSQKSGISVKIGDEAFFDQDTSMLTRSEVTAGKLPTLSYFTPVYEDFRISEMGGLGTAGFNQAVTPVVAYNSAQKQYFVVWSGDDDPESKDEIYGRLLDAFDGHVISTADLRIAEMTGGNDFDALKPDVVYNPVLDEFLVIWQGVHLDAGATSTVDQADEIFARRVSAEGAPLNPDGTTGTATTGLIRVSHMGSIDENGDYDALDPSVAYNPADNTYLVVWHGDDDASATQDGEYEIFAQLLKFTGGTLAVSGDNFQISDVAGDNGSSPNDAMSPDVVFNSANNEWLVIWEGEEEIAGEAEIFGQRLSSDGTEIITPGHNFKISSTPQPGNEARQAGVVWNSFDNQYLVVWCGEGAGSANEFDVFGKLLDENGEAAGNDFRISDMGPDTYTNFRAFNPRPAFSAYDNEYLVIWSGDDDTTPLVDGEYEVFGQRLTSTGTEVGENDFRISNMGPDGIQLYGAHSPDVIYTESGLNSFLVVWSGDDNSGTVDDELEIFARLISPIADIAVSKTDGVTEVIAGNVLTYTITVWNNGPDDVFNTTVVDNFEPAFTQINWTATGTGGASGFESVGSGHITDNGISLPQGATVIYTIHTIVDSLTVKGTILSNTVQVMEALAVDPNLQNNTATDDDTEVLRIADVAITKTDNVDMILAGGLLTYTLTVTNSGPVNAMNTTVTDTFPAEIIDVTWSAQGSGGAHGFESQGTGNIFDDHIFLPEGASVVYTALATVHPETADNIILVNTAFVLDSVATDPDLTNNSSTDDNTVVIRDPDPPIITLADPMCLWPPNHKYVTISLQDMIISVVDSVDGIIPLERVSIDSVSSDEAENLHEEWEDWFEWLLEFFRNLDHPSEDKRYDEAEIEKVYFSKDGSGNQINCFWGDGYTFNDIVIGPDCRSVDLRSERLGSGNGRVYSVYLSVSDSAGNKADTVYTINVPHDRKKKAIDDGPVYTVISDCHEETEQLALQKKPVISVLPEQYDLLQNYPNPFNPDTEIRFQLPEAGYVEIRIYNMLGQVIQVLASRNYEAGYHSVRWYGRDNRGSPVASGVYIYEMRTNGFVMHKKLVLTR